MCFVAAAAFAASELDPARVKEIAGWLSEKPAGFGRPVTDRTAWEKLAATPTFAGVVADAQGLAGKSIPVLSDELYLDFSRTGNRTRCERVLSGRVKRLVTFTLAECLENKGRFISPLASTIGALCQDRTWVMPAHDRQLNNFYGRAMEMDLRASALAWELATCDYLLGDKLPPKTRQLIHEHVQKRVLQPYREMVEGRRPAVWWIRGNNNWNAVCLAGVTGAALTIEESPAVRAWFIAAAQQNIRHFLSGFTPDGYCSEGIGYWNYGFGHFLMLGEAVRQATKGRVDLLADPAAFQPALFCTRTEIINGMYPTIADCHPGSRPDAQWVKFIGERLRLNLPDVPAESRARAPSSLFTGMMLSFPDSPLPAVAHAPVAPDSPLRTWFKDGGVLICRPVPGSPTAFAAVLKGGHNAESHNHNDVGSFSVIAGHSMVICDPGSEVYTARTFSARRYDSKVLSSYGHAVPVIAGQLQREGAQARGVVLRTDFTDTQDTLTLDIRSAYAVPELERLERTFVFHRGQTAGLTVRDEVAFSTPKAFETALITWGEWKKVSDTELLITDDEGAVRVKIDTGGQPFKLSSETLNEDVPTPKKPVRLGIALKSPLKAGTVTFTITPAAGKKK